LDDVPMNARMDSLPFSNAPRGLAHADVARMVASQMELARENPAAAIALLNQAAFEEAEPGADPAEVLEWMRSQREWLLGRLEEPSVNSVEDAIEAFGGAVEQLRQAVALEARNAEARATAAAAEAQERCDAMVQHAEERLASNLARARRKIRKEGERIRQEALADADRLMDRAGKHAAALLMKAERREQKAASDLARVREIEAGLLGNIEAARSTIGSRPPQAA
jgi:hypothetical protein